MDDLTAVIVEPRKHKALGPVLENLCSSLDNVPVKLIHGSENGQFAREAVPAACRDVQLLEVNAANLNAQSYSKLLTSRPFWDVADTENVLIFQTDSGICGTDHTPLKDALDYDYCGALAWKEASVGNGGLSVRKRETMKRLCPDSPTEKFEDRFFVEACKANQDCQLCPRDVANRFSVEAVGGDNSWGFHRNWRNLNILGLSFRWNKASFPLCDFNSQVAALNGGRASGKLPPKTWLPEVRNSPY